MDKKLHDSPPSPPQNGSLTDKDWLDLSWNYFSLLSGQRMSMIDFYIVIEVALIGALFALLGEESRILWAERTVAFAVFFISVIFYCLDKRTKDMIHSCEDAILNIEDAYKAEMNTVKLPFTSIKTMTEPMDQKKKRKLTYSGVFRIQFFVIGAFGLACFILLCLGVI